MTDPITITTALGSLKTAIEIAKLLKGGADKLAEAEQKLKLAELLSTLADAKVELVEVQEQIASRDATIADLREALKTKESLVRRYDGYYQAGPDGKPYGAARCARCWDVDHRPIALIRHRHTHGLVHQCPQCKTIYSDNLTERLPDLPDVP